MRAVPAAASALAAGLLLSACTLPRPDDGTEKPRVLTTFTVIADIARQVAGDHAVVESITKPGAEIHGYEPTPGDVRKGARADLVLDNGMNLEAWFGKFRQATEGEHVVVSDGVRPIAVAAGAAAGKPNPHAWMSPLNVITYVDNIVAGLSRIDPKHRATYERNGTRYQRRLRAVHRDLVTRLHAVPRPQRALVTCEGAFSYLARDAGLDEQYIWPVNAEQQATPNQLSSTIAFVRKRAVPAVFCESTVSDKAMQQVVRATGAGFGGTLYVDSLSAANGPVPSYLDLIRHDARLIVKALTRGTR